MDFFFAVPNLIRRLKTGKKPHDRKKVILMGGFRESEQEMSK